MLSKIQLIRGDITKVKADAIVNAANSSLLGGGGVDGAIHRVGGKKILEECQKIRDRQGGCETGQAVITTAGNLPARFVIHTVGPVWNGGTKDERQKLADCYRHSLELTIRYDCKTIAFPSISTGIYRFPKDLAAEIALQTITDFLEIHSQMEQVLLVSFTDEDHSILLEKAKEK